MTAKRGLCHSQDLRKLKKAYILLKNRYLVVFNPLKNQRYECLMGIPRPLSGDFNGVQIW